MQVLAKVTGPLDAPRGPDVLHRVTVRPQWLDLGATLELELPRNLTCAGCDGGGCDACERSGALTLRGRKEPPEIVEVVLPRRAPEAEPPSAVLPQSELPASSKRRVVRIPERGGFAPEGSELPRGHLLIALVEGDEPGPGIVAVHLPEVAPLEAAPELPVASAARRPMAVTIVAVAVVLFVALLVLARLLGWG